MSCFAVNASAELMEIDSLGEVIPAHLQNFDDDGKGICPDSVWLESINPYTAATIYNAWGDSTDSWIHRKIAPNDSDTSLFVNPVMDNIDGNLGLDAYIVRFGAYDSSELDYVWREFYVKVNREVKVGSVADNAITNTAIQDGAITYAKLSPAPSAWWNEGKTGYSLSGTQAFNVTGNITGSISGSVGSVTGNVGGSVNSVNSVALPVTVGDGSPGAFVAADFNADFFTAIYNEMIDGDNELPFRAVGFSTHSAADVYTYFTNGSNEDAFRGLLGDTTGTLAQEIHWLLLYTGAKPGMVTHLKPFGASPKTSQEIPGETYKVEWFLNPINPEVIDSGGVSE